jgi:hypothetical protein
VAQRHSASSPALPLAPPPPPFHPCCANNIQTKDTALFLAVQLGHFAAAELLLGVCADLSAKDDVRSCRGWSLSVTLLRAERSKQTL